MDPENGRGKAMVRFHENSVGEDDERSIRTSYEMYAYLLKHFVKSQVDLLKKKMKGIYKREIWYIPAKGQGSVNRRIKHCKTLDGSNSLHSFEDIGITGFLRVRERSCHRCPECWSGAPTNCSCGDMAHYPSQLVELQALSTTDRPLTRSALATEGKAMAETVEPGDFICVEIDSMQEPWMIGRVTSRAGDWPESSGEQYLWMGEVVPGDRVIWVEKLEGVGNTFTMTSKAFPVFVEDVRMVKLAMKEPDNSGNNRTLRCTKTKHVIDAQQKAQIIASMPMVLDSHTKCNSRDTFHR